jgi:hypothetical protein
MAKLKRIVVALLLCASAAQAQKITAPAKLCKAFHANESFSVEILKKRIADQKILVSDHDREALDTSCKMTGLMSGLRTLPSIWLKESEDGIPMHVKMQVYQKDRICQAYILDIEGC